MERKNKSPYSFMYKVGVSVFVVLVVIISFVITSITKSCNPIIKSKTPESVTFTQIDTVYLPNPNAVKEYVHDTIWKVIPCTKKHSDITKSTKDSTK